MPRKDFGKKKTIWEILPASPEHMPPIAANMREEDRREVWAGNRKTPEEALEISLLYSDLAWTCFVDGLPAFMWGVCRHGRIFEGTGVPWLLGTDGILKVKKEFLKQSRAYVERMQRGFTRLENIVHAKNALSIRWLAWCGFTIDKDNAMLVNGEKFYQFWRVSNE